MAANASAVACTCCTFLSWCWTSELSPPQTGSPHVTTDPSARIAANAQNVAWTCCTGTLLSFSWTAELSAPQSSLALSGSPQVRIPLSPGHHRAKAFFVALSFGSCAITVRWSPSWSPALSRDLVRSDKAWPLAVTSLRNPFPKKSWAKILKSSTLEDCAMERRFLFPLGKATSTWSIRKKLPFTQTVSPIQLELWDAPKHLEPKSLRDGTSYVSTFGQPLDGQQSSVDNEGQYRNCWPFQGKRN